MSLATGQPSSVEKNETAWGQPIRLLLDAFATIFWLYAVIKLFVFDVDVWALQHVDQRLVPLLTYKILIIFLGLSVAMIVTRSLSLGIAILYIFFFPVVLIWKTLRIVWNRGSWLLALSLINLAISFFQSFKKNFILLTLFAIAMVLIFSTSKPSILFVCSGAMFSVVSIAYLSTLTRAFKPSAVFQAYKTVFPAVRKTDLLKIDTDVTLLPTNQLTDKQTESRNNSLQNVVLYNRTCLFLAKQLRDYQRSRINTVSHIGNLVSLLLLTIIAFSLINFATWKVHPDLYEFSYSQPSFFAFVYYATGSMFYASNGLVPTSALSQGIQLAQIFFSVMLFVILVTLIISMRDEKYAAEIEEVIQSVERDGREMENVVRTGFNLSSIGAAIEALETAKVGMAGFIVAITKTLDDAHEAGNLLQPPKQDG